MFIINNMVDINDLFIFGEDFDIILGILEEEEELDEQFIEVVGEVSIGIFFSNLECSEKLSVQMFILLQID